MTDDLVKRLRGRSIFCRGRGEIKSPELMEEAVDRIEQLEHERYADALALIGEQRRADAARAIAKATEALREIAAEASVPVHTWKNGINFKKMYEGWRRIATERIDVARAVLAELDKEKPE